MDFHKYLKKASAEIEKEKNNILLAELKRVQAIDKKLIPLIKAFIKSSKGGKGIRGALIKMAYESSGGKSKDIIKISAAYELMHTAILVHDDIMDKSLTRRNKPSLYADLGNNHYGISQAITLGDFGFFLSYRIISGTSFPDYVKNKVLNLFSKVMETTALGQMLDLENADRTKVNRLKTACYTISGPLQIGAMLAQSNEKLIRNLEKVGEYLGIAYQIRDDILDSEVKELDNLQKEEEAYIKKALILLAKDQKLSKLFKTMADYLIERKK